MQPFHGGPGRFGRVWLRRVLVASAVATTATGIIIGSVIVLYPVLGTIVFPMVGVAWIVNSLGFAVRGVRDPGRVRRPEVAGLAGLTGVAGVCVALLAAGIVLTNSTPIAPEAAADVVAALVLANGLTGAAHALLSSSTRDGVGM